MINKHGLPRKVPESVMREVRKRCGFGCVLCGFAFFDYEHFSPEYSEAHEHNAKGITLLCPTCNQKKRRGWLSPETVASGNENPQCLKQGYCDERFDFGSSPLTVEIAGNKFYACDNVIEINGLPILSITPQQMKANLYKYLVFSLIGKDR